MPFFKWKAYDSDIKYKSDSIDKYCEGVVECERYEIVVMQLAQKGLVAKEIQKIDYAEFRRLKSAELKLEALKHKIDRLKTPKTELNIEPEKPKWHKVVIIAAISIAVIAILVFLSNLQYAHRF